MERNGNPFNLAPEILGFLLQRKEITTYHDSNGVYVCFCISGLNNGQKYDWLTLSILELGGFFQSAASE